MEVVNAVVSVKLAKIAATPAHPLCLVHVVSVLLFNFPPSCHSSSGLLSCQAHLSEKSVPWLEGKLLDGADGIVTEVKCAIAGEDPVNLW